MQNLKASRVSTLSREGVMIWQLWPQTSQDSRKAILAFFEDIRRMISEKLENNISTSINREMYDALKAAAKKRKVKMSQIIREIIALWVSEQQWLLSSFPILL